MKIDCIADLHGHFPKLHGGDLLIVAGDLTAHDIQEEFDEFDTWLDNQKYKKKIFIAGNHDNLLVKEKPRVYRKGFNKDLHEKFEYLCDSGTEFEGLKIWGSPWTLTFEGINPHCKAFTVDKEKQLQEKWELIPNDIDILITHMPPLYMLDDIRIGARGMRPAGSSSLNRHTIRNKDPLKNFPNLRLHVFGHFHENGGKKIELPKGTHVNASIMNEHYKPVNEPVRIEF